MKTPAHHHHAYCGDLCVPMFLHEEFNGQLGTRAGEFDLLSWYPKRDSDRQFEQIVVEEPLTWWREAFRAELRARGWVKPRPAVTPAKPSYHPMVLGAWRCPHTPRCANTTACIAQYLQEQRALRCRV
jgi:hypothetical protein